MSRANIQQTIDMFIATGNKLRSLPAIAGDNATSERIAAVIGNLGGVRRCVDELPGDDPAAMMWAVGRFDDELAEFESALADRRA